MKFRYKILLILLCLFSFSTRADLILSSPPILTEEKSKALYEPFAEALSSILDENVTYKYPKDWLVYAKEMRLGNYDLLFDQPHFVSWRLQPQNIFHRALVSLPSYEKYVVISRLDSGYIGIEDLLYAKVCSLPSPDISTIVFLSQFSNPVRQPVMVEAKGNYSNVYKKLMAKSCQAAVVSQNFYDKLVEEGKTTDLNLLFTSQQIHNLTLTITKKQPTEKAEKIIAALIDELSPKGADGIFEQFGIEENKFSKANINELNQLKGMLQGVVWGW